MNKEIATSQEVDSFAAELLWAIRQERQVTPNSVELRVVEVMPHNLGVQVRLESIHGNSDDVVVDERFRNAHVHAEGLRSVNGKKVLALLDPELDDVVVLSGAAPHSVYPGQVIEIRAYDFFIPLIQAWDSKNHGSVDWNRKAYEKFLELSNPRKVGELDLRATPIATHVSPTQAGVLQLVQMSAAYSVGPPGSGKTETNAVVLAAFLMANPQAKILLVGVANFALDQLLERLDYLLKEYGRNDLRQQITRYGNGVGPLVRLNCPHFLPGATDPFQAGYAHAAGTQFDLELGHFDPEHKQTRLFAMTVASALQRIDSLREMGAFDFCLVEEASQASLAQILPLAAISTSIFLAGDPAQLSPVAKHHDAKVRKWMAASPFSQMPDISSEAVWVLTEQRRMADSICRLVSDMAYAESGLVTASDVLNSRSWNTARHKAFGPYSPDRHLIVHPICERVEVHGPVRVREESIEEILGMLSQCRTDGFQAKDVLVITPFRDQARLIRKRLAHAGFREVTVSTVHRTQGSAKKVVIFDVVDGRHPFLQTDEAKRLLTVAFSRAEAKLLVLASQRDLAHPILQMAEGAANLEAVKLLAARGSNLSVNRPGYRGGPLG